jgi:hypothetical protein
MVMLVAQAGGVRVERYSSRDAGVQTLPTFSKPIMV